MATVTLGASELRVRFSWWERLALRRAGMAVPLGAVRAVECVGEPLSLTRGGRFGVIVSGFVKIGVWGFGTGSRQLVSVRRGRPALRIRLDRAAAGGRFDELLLGVRDAERIVDAIGVRR